MLNIISIRWRLIRHNREHYCACYYLRRRDKVMLSPLSVRPSVCLAAKLLEKFRTNFDDFWKGEAWLRTFD